MQELVGEAGVEVVAVLHLKMQSFGEQEEVVEERPWGLEVVEGVLRPRKRKRKVAVEAGSQGAALSLLEEVVEEEAGHPWVEVGRRIVGTEEEEETC